MEILRQAMAVAAVLALLGGSLWWLRRSGCATVVRPRRRGGRLLKTLERLPLGPQHALHLVRVGDRVLVVGCAPGGCTVLADVGHEASREVCEERGSPIREVLP